VAIQHALDKSGLKWSEIDLIIDCSTTRIRPIPCNAVYIQSSFSKEASGIPCFDIESTGHPWFQAREFPRALMNYKAVLA
jgi:3-oxoacyl-[acyl-carrier-protein] synthase-3